MSLVDDRSPTSFFRRDRVYVAIILFMAGTFFTFLAWPELRWPGNSLGQAILFFLIPAVFAFIYFQARQRKKLIGHNTYLDTLRYGPEDREGEIELIRRALEKDDI